MAISRPVLLALVGLALLGATVFAVNNARNSGDDGAAPVAKSADPSAPAPTPAPEPAQASGKLSAEAAVSAILSPGKPVDSARVSISLDGRDLSTREHDTLKLAGTFASSNGAVPSFDLRATSRDQEPGGKGENFDVRMLSTGSAGYVGSGDSLHQLPGPVMEGVGKLRSVIGDSPASKLPEFEPARWVKNPKVVGVETLDGVDATHVTGKILAANVGADVLQLVRAEAEPLGDEAVLPGNTPAMARKAVKSATLDAWVGADRVVRRVRVSANLNVPKRLLDKNDSPRQAMVLEFSMSDVNKVEPIEAPATVDDGPAARTLGAKDAKTASNLLAFSALAVDAPGGFAATTYSALRLNRMTDSEKVSKAALRAVEQGKEVVIFFNNPRALDDQATAESVKYLSAHTKKLAVFTDDVGHTRSYGELVEKLGVSQAPAIVFINRRGKASLVEGYVDGPSLVQVVADAR
jgi:hypothetical protein